MKTGTGNLGRVCLAAFFAAVCTAQAQTATWTGAAGATWSDGGNWDTGTAPGTEDIAVFDSASAPNAPRVTADTTIAEMQLDVDQEFRANTKAELYVTGPVTGTGGILMTGDNTGTFGDNGRLELRSAANTFEGGVEIRAGTVRFGNSGLPADIWLGLGDILIAGGTFSFTPSQVPCNTAGAPQTPGTRSFKNLLKVGPDGGRSHMNVGSGKKPNFAAVYGDIELGGPLAMASNGGGNDYGYTIDGTITVPQDTARTAAIYSETGHNGADYISGRIVDGAGTAANPIHFATGAKNLNICCLGSTYAGGTVFDGDRFGIGSLIFRPCSTLGTGGVVAKTGSRVTIQNLAPLGEACSLAPSATIRAEAGAIVSSGFAQVTVKGTRTDGSTVITFEAPESTVDMYVGQSVTGSGIPADTTVASIDSHTQITLSNEATSSGSGNYTFAGRSQNTTSRFTSDSLGIYGIDSTYAFDLDQSAFGGGRMFIGTVQGGTYAGQLSPGADNAYRVGGGEISDALGTSGGKTLKISEDDALSGDAKLIVGPGKEAGGAYRGVVVLNGANSYTGGTVVNSGAALLTGRTDGAATGSGKIIVQDGGAIGAAGTNGSFFDGAKQFSNYALLPGATLLLSEYLPGNYTGSNGGQGRWGDAADIDLADNTFYAHGGKNNTATETAGTFRFADFSRINLAEGGGTSRYLLTVDSIERVGGGLFMSNYKNGIGGGLRLRTVAGHEPVVVNGIVAPCMLDGNGSNFLTYDATEDAQGVIGLKPFSAYVALASAGPDDVAVTGAVTLNGDVSVYALKVNGNDVKGAGATIHLGSGGFINTKSSKNFEPALDFSAAEGVLFTSADLTLKGSIVAPNGLIKCGTGNAKLSGGANAIEGRLFVAQGTLQLENAESAADWDDCELVVSSSGTVNLNGRNPAVAGLAGSGTVSGGSIAVAETFAPGGSRYPGRLRTGGLALGSECTSTFKLLETFSDAVEVAGDLTLDGTLDVVAAGDFTPGTYAIMTYTGDLTDNGIAVGSTPETAHVTIDTSEPGVVKLVATEQMPRTVILLR